MHFVFNVLDADGSRSSGVGFGTRLCGKRILHGGSPTRKHAVVLLVIDKGGRRGRRVVRWTSDSRGLLWADQVGRAGAGMAVVGTDGESRERGVGPSSPDDGVQPAFPNRARGPVNSSGGKSKQSNLCLGQRRCGRRFGEAPSELLLLNEVMLRLAERIGRSGGGVGSGDVGGRCRWCQTSGVGQSSRVSRPRKGIVNIGPWWFRECCHLTRTSG